MSKFHINKHGVPAPCKATKGNCPLGGEERHFDSQEAAQEYADKVNAEEHGVLPGINSNESRAITHAAEEETNEIVEALFSNYFQEDEIKNEELLLSRLQEEELQEEKLQEEEVENEREEETTFTFAYLNGEKVVGIRGDDEKALQIVAEDFKEEIKMQQEDNENNYGLLFYRHGYNGKAQTETREYYRREYGVDVF